MADKKDRWDKVDVVGKLLSALLVPFALVFVGQRLGEQTAARDDARQREERELEAGRRRLDRVNTLIENLSSDNVQRRRLAVEWAKYLDTVKELPPQVAVVLLQVALTDPNPDVAASAANVIAGVATGNATIRGLAVARLGDKPPPANDSPRSSSLDPLVKVLSVPVLSAEGVVSLAPCSVSSALPFFGPNCDRATAKVVDVCTSTFPKSATVRATRVFTKWANDPRPWDQAETTVGNEGDWNVFERTFSRPFGDNQQICATFRHWSSHQERLARIEVTYASAGAP